ncbi:MAG: CoA-acylating methylmalonate-semialdehyde dehydrogenase [Francisellaceae bacterium]
MSWISHLIAGEKIVNDDHQIDIYNPATAEVVGKLAMGSQKEVDQAVIAARNALASWSLLSPLKRARILFNYNALLNQHKHEIAALITKEHGKVYADALGEVQRGIEVVEFACGIPELLKSQYSHQVSTDVDCYAIRQPVGVCVGITPFNFPVMVPMWMFPIAIACGNTFVLKPSEKDPSSTMKIVELIHEAGLPKGVVNVVHGDKAVVDGLLRHPDVDAVSFVGSTPVAKYVYETASFYGKRVQALGGAKNHCVVMPDADMDDAVDGLMGAAFGSAGERCMAISVAVAVGDKVADQLIERLSDKIDRLKVSAGVDKEAEMGPVITKRHQQNIAEYIDSGIKEGAKLIKDGRRLKVDGYENGYFVGPSLFDHVDETMRIYKEEIFGPVLSVVRVDSLVEALALINRNPYGNGSSIYTADGSSSRLFSSKVTTGMVGVNIPIPVPMAFHSFGGWKNSLFGDTHVHGSEGVHFYTRLKTITTKWVSRKQESQNPFMMPTLQ